MMVDPRAPHTQATPWRHIMAVNGKFCGACIAGGIAVWLWPHSPDWWTFYPLSVLCGAAALACVMQAIKLIRRIRTFERDQADFEKLGVPVKKAGLADEDILTSDGVIRHGR